MSHFIPVIAAAAALVLVAVMILWNDRDQTNEQPEQKPLNTPEQEGQPAPQRLKS